MEAETMVLALRLVADGVVDPLVIAPTTSVELRRAGLAVA